MSTLFTKLFSKKCANCELKITNQESREISALELEEINPYGAYKIVYLNGIQRTRFNICERCSLLLEDALERKHARKQAIEEYDYLLEQEKAEIEYHNRLKRKVELKLLERQAVELDIDLKEVKNRFSD